MDGVKRAQRVWPDRFGRLDHLVGEGNNVKVLVQDAPRVGDDLGVPTAQGSSHQLDATYRTSDMVTIRSTGQPPPKIRRL